MQVDAQIVITQLLEQIKDLSYRNAQLTALLSQLGTPETERDGPDLPVSDPDE